MDTLIALIINTIEIGVEELIIRCTTKHSNQPTTLYINQTTDEINYYQILQAINDKQTHRISLDLVGINRTPVIFYWSYFEEENRQSMSL